MTAQAVMAQEVMAQEVMVQEVTAQVVTAQEVMAQEVTAQEVMVQEVTAQAFGPCHSCRKPRHSYVLPASTWPCCSCCGFGEWTSRWKVSPSLPSPILCLSLLLSLLCG